MIPGPTSDDALARADALAAAGDAAGAIGLCRAVLAERPDHPAALARVSGLLQASGDYEAALGLAETAIGARPGSGGAWLVKGDALLNLGRVQDALQAYQRAGRAKGSAFDGAIRIGIAQGHLARGAAAAKAFADALALNPASPLPKYQRGLMRLKLGDYAKAWDDYEARWDIDGFVRESAGQTPPPLIPELLRSPSRAALAGKRVMLLGEQGVGDQVMFASMVPDLIAAARSVVMVVNARLVGLFQASFPQAVVTDPQRAAIDVDDIDVVVALGSLGAAFRRDAGDFPGAPYLTPGPDAVARWTERLGGRRGRLRVGLSWRGGVHQTRRSLRSIPLEQLAPVLALPDCEFVSLQYGDVAHEIEAAQARLGVAIRAFPGDALHDFADIAAAVGAMDAVVTVQTALAHVAGAVGTPCLALIPSIAEWRYGVAGERMAWYASLRLLRQETPGDWDPVIARAAAALADIGGN